MREGDGKETFAPLDESERLPRELLEARRRFGVPLSGPGALLAILGAGVVLLGLEVHNAWVVGLAAAGAAAGLLLYWQGRR